MLPIDSTDSVFKYDFKYAISTIKSSLKEIFSKIIGEKALIIDSEVEHLLNHLLTRKFLQKLNIQKTFILKNNPEIQFQYYDIQISSVIYLIKPSVLKIKNVADHSKIFKNIEKNNFYLFCIPQITRLAFEAFENQNNIEQYEDFNLNFVPIQRNLFSTETENFYRDCFYLKETSSLKRIAMALLQIQNQHGRFSIIKGLGECSKTVIKILEQMEPKDSINLKAPPIAEVILFDRNIDMITPFLTDRTYGSALNELYPVSGSFITMQSNLINLNEDPIFFKIQNEPFFMVPEKIKTLLAEYIHHKKEVKKSLEESKSGLIYDGKLKFLASKAIELDKIQNAITLHQNILENILSKKKSHPHYYFNYKQIQKVHLAMLKGKNDESLEYIYDCLNEMDACIEILCLMVLKSQIDGGFDKRDYKKLWKNYFECGGNESFSTMLKLKKANLLNLLERKNPHFNIKKLINTQDSDLDNQPYENYTPLSIHLIKNLIDSNIENLEPFKNLFFETKQVSSDKTSEIIKESSDIPFNKPIKLIFFVGGCTWGEIAAVHLLEKSDPSHNYLIGTTKIINGKEIIESILQTDYLPV